MDIRNIKFLRWFGINGIVLWPFVLYADKEPHPAVRNHEAIHLFQIKRVGVAKFYLRYLGEYALGRWSGLSHDGAYRNISFEKEAYANQFDTSYIANFTRSSDVHTSPRNTRSREQS